MTDNPTQRLQRYVLNLATKANATRLTLKLVINVYQEGVSTCAGISKWETEGVNAPVSLSAVPITPQLSISFVHLDVIWASLYGVFT